MFNWFKKKKQSVVWKKEKQTFNVGKAVLVVTSTTGVVEKIPVMGHVEQFVREKDWLGCSYDVYKFNPRFEPVIVAKIDTWKKFATDISQSKTEFSPTPTLVVYQQIVLSVELTDVQDNFVEFDVVTGFEIVEEYV